jgi:hypothetical protein
MHELDLPRPSARVDVAVVNGEFAGFEIKSDVDSLRRLPGQIAAFAGVFDRVSLVTTDRHLTEAKKVVPAWWGIVYTRRGKIDYDRYPDLNPHVRPDSLLWLLKKVELMATLRSADIDNFLAADRYSALARRALENLSLNTIKEAVRLTLKSRCERSPSTTIRQGHLHSPRYWLPKNESAGECGC